MSRRVVVSWEEEKTQFMIMEESGSFTLRTVSSGGDAERVISAKEGLRLVWRKVESGLPLVVHLLHPYPHGKIISMAARYGSLSSLWQVHDDCGRRVPPHSTLEQIDKGIYR